MMLLSDWFLARQEKRIQAAREEGYAEGYAKGYAEGYAEGYAAAKAENGVPVKKSPDSLSKSRGEPFTKPLPGPPEKRSKK